MVRSEREMVRKLMEDPPAERLTSLQPTYEDSVPPDADAEADDAWEYEAR